MKEISAITAIFAVLGDPTRVRLLALLAHAELSVAELTRITSLPQSRVSTHLAKLRDANFIRDRPAGSSTFYRLDESRMCNTARNTWKAIVAELDDEVVTGDRDRCDELVCARNAVASWPDAVAGHMEHHYSPGRTWEATARAFVGLIRLGDVLDVGSGDGVMAHLLAPRARRYTCLDRSEKIVAAARTRLAHLQNVEFIHGDMAHMNLPDESFDQVLLLSVLTYAEQPERVLAETRRVLRPGGVAVVVTLDEHRHMSVSAAYEHINQGFSPERLGQMLRAAGLAIDSCERTARERRKPYFDVVSAFVHRPH